MKVIILFLFLFSIFFVSSEVTPREAVGIVGERLSDVGKNTDIYTEILGENILKFQELFIGALKFISLGFFDVGGEMDFARFLFAVMLFMLLYGIVGFIFKKFNFWIAGIVTILAFIGIDEATLEVIFLNYEAMGIAITVVLPVLILLAFTFRIYQKAYEGRSKVNPFYAEMFNLVFLIFFGVFFIRHSASEEGLISLMRVVSGWVLIILGVMQTVFYKILARTWHIQRVKNREFEESIRKMKRDASDAVRDIELGALDKT